MSASAGGVYPRGIWVLFWSELILTSGLALSFPFFALYLNRTRGVPMGAVGAFLCATLALAAVSQGFGGELSDTVGRRRVLVWSMWARTALVALLAESVRGSWPVPAVLGAYLAAMIVGSFFRPASYSWVADHCHSRRRLEAYGLLRVATNAGWAVGPALGGLVASSSYPAMFLASAGACGACAVLLSVGIEGGAAVATEDGFSLRGLLGAARDARFASFCLFSALIAAVMAQLVIPLSVHSVRWVGLSERQVGLLFSVNGALVVAVQHAASRFLGRRRITTALAAGSLLYAAGYACVGFAGGFAALAAAMVVITLGEVAVSPGLQALAANMAPQGRKGRYLGLSNFAQNMGTAAGPLMGGLSLQYLSPRWTPAPWLLVATVAVAAAAGFGSMRGRFSAGEEGLEFPAGLAAPHPEVA